MNYRAIYLPSINCWYLAVEILTARQKKAEELKRLTDLASQMAEAQLSELRAEIKVRHSLLLGYFSCLHKRQEKVVMLMRPCCSFLLWVKV